jgi:hypothetical protein
MAPTGSGAGGERRKSKAKDCAHLETGLRYLFTPDMGRRVIAIAYCRNCGKELSRETVAVRKDADQD